MDNLSLISILGLLLLNAFQLFFWSRQTGLLVDKLMSRNYAEYKQVEHLTKSTLPNSQTQTEELPNIKDPVLDELNGLLLGVR